MSTAFRALVHTRYTSKRFQPGKTINATVLKEILELTLVRFFLRNTMYIASSNLCCKRSPSSFNLQPFQVIVVKDVGIKNELSESAMIGVGNAYRTKDCSALAVFLADLQVSQRIAKIHKLGGGHPDYLASMPIRAGFFLGEGDLASTIKSTALSIASLSKPVPEIEPIRSWSSKNAAMAIQTYVLAATSHGLATAIMEGFDPRRMKDILQIPDRYVIPMVVATGYEYEENVSAETTSPRLDLNEVVFDNVFGRPLDFETLNDGELDQKV